MIQEYKSRLLRGTISAVLLFLVGYSIHGVLIVETNWRRIGGFRTVLGTISRFFPPAWSYVLALGEATLDTFLIATIGTFLALILALPVTWFAARNFSPFNLVTYPVGRFIMTLTRSVHEIVWALIFVAALGLGPFAGILALGLRSIGFVSKRTAEAVEDIDNRPIEAIEATGANAFQVFLYAVIPQVWPHYIGTAIFQWDINIRRATIIGIVGGGGLGLLFNQKMQAYQYSEATAVLIAILVLVLAGELVSTQLRRRLG